MSSAGARVIVRGVQPADRAAWDKLFQAYREFYKLPHDAAVRARAAAAVAALLTVARMLIKLWRLV